LLKPLKIQIVERARALIADEEHWCRGELARDARGMGVCPITDSAVKRCGLGAAYEITAGHRAAYDLAVGAVQPLYGTATLVKVNDIRGHAAACAARRSYRSGVNQVSAGPASFEEKDRRDESAAINLLSLCWPVREGRT
jgi:hypothetical protein